MVGEPNQDEEMTTRRRIFHRLSTEIMEPTVVEPTETPPDNEEVRPLRNHSKLMILYILLIVFRVYNGLIVITWFDPDETWQSLEVAHNIVFGVGKLTWEWKLGIRSSLHPMVFAFVYKVVQLLGLDDTLFLIRAPRILQAIISASGDFYAFLLASKLFGPECGRWTLFCVLCNWFNFYCGIRTYSNSIEASLTMIALYYWPFPKTPSPTRRDLRLSLAFAAISCIIRPTSALIWANLGVRLLLEYPHRVIPILSDAIVTGVFTMVGSVYVDRLFYRKWILVQWEFLRVNVMERISEFYGVHPFHWYLTQGLPLVIFTFLPIVLYGYSTVQHPQKQSLFWMCAFVVVCLSWQRHKEFRFLLPLVSPLMIYAGRGLQMISKSDRRNNRRGSKSKRNQIVAMLVATNLMIGYYFSRVHKRGVMDMTLWLRNEVKRKQVQSVLYLMPCHSAPFYSHIHDKIPMNFISCEPPIGMKDRKEYKDETDLLYQNPKAFIETYFSPKIGNKTLSFQQSEQTRYTWPSHLIWYDNNYLAPLLQQLMTGSNYHECARFFNTHFHDDSKQKGDIVVSCQM